MISIKNPIPKVAGVLALAILLIVGCAKTPKDPEANRPPDTFVTSYQIDIVPDTATFYFTTVYWRGSDVDGEIESFRYWVDVANPPDSEKIATFDASTRVHLNFSPTSLTHTFYVQSRDNQGEYDPTPASIAMSISDVRRGDLFMPNTQIVEGPQDGALTSAGIHLVLSGSVLGGRITAMQYKLETDVSWTQVPDTSGIGTVTVNLVGMSLGGHTLAIRAVDNILNVDPSPVTVSFNVVDTLRPDLYVVSGPIPNAFYFLPSGGNTVDLAASWFGDASWYFSTVVFRYAVDDTANWSAWQAGASANLVGLTAGAHVFYVEAMDLASHVSLYITNFGIGQLLGDEGILVVNGISWPDYGPQAMYVAGVPYGSHSFHFWDLFDVPRSTYPPVLDSVFIGSGAIPGDSLGRFSSVVLLLNNFNGDLEVYNSIQPLVLSYLNGGGNVAFGCRFGASFIVGDLLTYGHSGTLVFNNIGVAPTGGLTAVAPGLVDMPRIGGQSFTDLLEAPVPEGVTVLFDVPGYSESVGGILVEPQGKGKMVFIAGRPYRYDFAAQATNYNYILTNYFGER